MSAKATTVAPSGAGAASLTIVSAAWADRRDAIVALRAAVAPELGLEDAWDPAATHLLVYRDDHLAGAVRMNFATASGFDFEPILPLPIPEACRHELLAVSRLVVSHSEGPAAPMTVRRLIREACLCSWSFGCRASVVAAPDRLAPLYRRIIGLEPISALLTHPRTGRPVRLMRYVPAPGGRGVIDDVVGDLPGVRVSAELMNWLAHLEAMSAKETS